MAVPGASHYCSQIQTSNIVDQAYPNIHCVLAPASSRLFTNLNNGHSYYFSVRAINSNAQSTYSTAVYAMPISQTADTFPAPTNLTRTEPDDGTLQVSWDGYNEVTNYRIYYSLSPDVTSTASYREVTGTTTTYSLTDLDHTLRYYIKVAAVNVAGVGDLSAEVAGTPFIFTSNSKPGDHDDQYYGLGIAESGRVYTAYDDSYDSALGRNVRHLKAYQSIDSMSSPIWSLSAENSQYMPLVSKIDETIYLGGTPLRAVDKNGNLKWTFTADICTNNFSGLALNEEGVLFTTGCNNLYAINPDGSLKWQKADIRGGSSSLHPFGVIL